MSDIPNKYDPAATEAKWATHWEETGVYHWDPRGAGDPFTVDTPPPTASGALHMGHVFSYTHQDILVRYQRMCGRKIFYGMGWDDNGLPTERRVQNILGIRCDPKAPYVPDWKPTRGKKKKDGIEEVSRRNFIEACGEITEEDEVVFETLWRHLGLSVDWRQTYATIDANCRTASQLSFLDLVEKNQVYNIDAPTMWDTDFKTAVAQAEVEDRERPGAYHDIRFGLEDGGEFTISTTRPELLAACIAVVAHPDDARYQPYFGQKATTPIFKAQVPVLASEHADPEKGTGILMVCTFGDAADVDWWKGSSLAIKQVIGLDGRFLPVEFGASPFNSEDPSAANAAYAEIQGLFARQARRKMAELLAAPGSALDGESAALVGEPQAIQHPVKFYEKGDRPLEFVPTRQWFVKILEHKEALLAQGRKIQWHPTFMRTRYDHWVEGLNQDWCISRQRYFGVPFPVWYPLDAHGQPRYEAPIYAAKDQLPVDPLADAAPGFTETQRDQPGGFMGDPDVMDTWATSSLTPQIQSHWEKDDQRHGELFPFDVRPQSHEIIRTWAFYTIVKAWMHENEVPWRHVVISGWILDPDRKKMSKSKGNVVTPDDLLITHSVDAVRYWAGRAGLGVDTAFDDQVFKVGKRLATKIFNASRFVHMQIDDEDGLTAAAITHPLDIAMVGTIREVVAKATESFERFEYAGALHRAEDAFWSFCDHYLELVKTRAYAEDPSPERSSARATLMLGLSAFLRLLAPFMPYVTEEVWSWRFATADEEPSIHRASWPSVNEFAATPTDYGPESFGAAVEVLTQVRGAKSLAKKSLKWPVTRLTITSTDAHLQTLEPVLADVLRAGKVDAGGLHMVSGEVPEKQRFQIAVVLGDAPSP